MRRGNWLGRLVVAIAVAIVMSAVPAFAGDRISDLTRMLSSSSEKTRMSAVISLARLGDRRTLKPLVTALHDPNAQVRAIAATALGKLGHKAALPALKNAAEDDLDAAVRTKARHAARLVAKANHIKDDDVAPAEPPAQARAKRKTTGFGRSPHAVEDRPDLYVAIKGTNDDSPGKTDKKTRKAHAEFLKLALQDQLRAAPQVTMIANEGHRWGLDARMIDVSVVKLDVVQAGGYVEVAAELRLAISDDRGKLLSFLSGGAKVQIPVAKYRPRFLPNMRKEALEGALKGMFDKLLVHLRQMATT